MERALVRKHWVTLVAIAWISLETWLVGWIAMRNGHPQPFALALAVDVTLVAGGAWWFARPAPIGGRRVLQIFALSAVGIGVIARLTGAPLPTAWVRALGASVETALLGSAGWLLWRSRGSASAVDVLSRILPSPIAALLVGEVELVAASMRALQPTPSLDAGPQSYPALEGSRSGWIVPFIAITSLVELAAAHALLWRFLHSASAHALLLGVHVYGLIWLIGDRRLMAESRHHLEPTLLSLRLGARFNAQIPFDQIERALALSDDAARRRVQPRTGHNPRVSPGDAPNLHLCLKANIEARSYFGLRRSVLHLDLFVGRSAELLDALSRAGVIVER